MDLHTALCAETPPLRKSPRCVHVTVRSRSQFEDHEDPTPKRPLLRRVAVDPQRPPAL